MPTHSKEFVKRFTWQPLNHEIEISEQILGMYYLRRTSVPCTLFTVSETVALEFKRDNPFAKKVVYRMLGFEE